MSKPRKATLIRTTFVTNRAAEFFTESELRMQIGYEKPLWPLVIVKELVDNSLDACESIEAEPKIEITLEPDSISVAITGQGSGSRPSGLPSTMTRGSATRSTTSRRPAANLATR